MECARTNARDKEGLDLAGQQQKAVAAAPPYLKQRVVEEEELPRVEVVTVSQDNKKLVACVKYALGLEGGGGVEIEGQAATEGMVEDVFVALCELLVPTWDRANV